MRSHKSVYMGVPLNGSFKGFFRAFWVFRGLGGVVISGVISPLICALQV